MASWAKISLFLSSYVPLFVLLAVRTSGQSGSAWAVFSGLAILGVVGLILILRGVRARQVRRVTVSEADSVGEQVAAYVATYLLPFLTVTFVDWRDWLVFFGFLALVCLVYVQSDLVHLNPLLSLCGYSIYRVQYRSEGTLRDEFAPAEMLLLSKRPVRGEQMLSIRKLSQDVGKVA